MADDVSLPPPIELSPDRKKVLIDGIRKVVDLYRSRKLIPADHDYPRLLQDPLALHRFIATYRDKPAVADSIVVAKSRGMVRDEKTLLVCGVTLAQVQHMMVRTCARKYYESDFSEAVVAETVTSKRFLFFSKTETVERMAPDPDEARMREIVKYVAFDWQLPLLDFYRGHLNPKTILGLGESILLLKSEEAIRGIAEIDPAVISKGRDLAGADFVNLINYPAAIPGASKWNREWYVAFRNAMGMKAFEFFTRSSRFFNIVAELERPTIKLYGELLCSIADENLLDMTRLNMDRTDALLQALRSVFGDALPLILAQPSFSKEFLRKMVDGIMHMSGDKGSQIASLQLALQASMPQVREWLARVKAETAVS